MTSGGPTPTKPAVRFPPITTPSRPAVVAGVAGVIVVAIVIATANALPIFVVGIGLAYLIDPPVSALAARGVPRWVASILLIVVLCAIIAGFIALVAGSIITQGAALIASAPASVEELRARIASAPLSPDLRGVLDRLVTDAASSLASVDLLGVATTLVGSLFGVFGIVIGTIGVPFYIFIVVNDHPGLEAELERRLPEPWREDILTIVRIVVHQFGNYVRSEAILMVLLGALTWVGLAFLAFVVDPRIGSYAVFLAAIAAFSELIPLLGPWLAATPAVLFGLTLGPVPLVAIVVLYVVISFIEGSVMVPAIEGRSFALRPAIVGPVLAIGFALGGTFGAVLALPVASAARDVYVYVFGRSTGRPAGSLPGDA